MSGRIHRHQARPRAFTMVEILVVIGILALLLGMLLPALSGAQKRSLKQKELNAIRQVGLAWNLYANGNNDKLLPGWLAPEVQAKWRVSYEYPNHNDISPAPTYSNTVPNLAGPWTWRLMPYLEYNHDMVHGYAEEPEFDAVMLGADADEAGEIAVQPSFGYNANYVGGYWTMETGFARPRFHDVTVVDTRTGSVVKSSANLVARSTGTIRRSTQLITFCSSSLLTPRAAPNDVYKRFDFTQPGWHIVSPSWLGNDRQWEWAPGLRIHAQNATPPIGRYNGLAATQYADGHTAANQIDDLWREGLTMWIDAMVQRDYRHD